MRFGDCQVIGITTISIFSVGRLTPSCRKLKRQAASIPLEPALSHQSTLVEILYYSHYLFLIVQDRTQHGDRMSWVLDPPNSFTAIEDKKEHVLLESFLHACFVQHEKIKTLESWPASKTEDRNLWKHREKRIIAEWQHQPKRDEECGHTGLLRGRLILG